MIKNFLVYLGLISKEPKWVVPKYKGRTPPKPEGYKPGRVRVPTRRSID